MRRSRGPRRLPAPLPRASADALRALPVRRDAEPEIADERCDGRPGDEEVVVGDAGAGHAHAKPPERGEDEPPELPREHELVDDPMAGEGDARAEQHEMQQAARVSQDAMRQELEEV